MYATVQCENLTNSVSHAHRPNTVKLQTVVRSTVFGIFLHSFAFL